MLRMKRADAFRFIFLTDDQDISYLPTWVKSPKQITDGHLVELASANEGALATLDERIAGAYLIPAK